MGRLSKQFISVYYLALLLILIPTSDAIGEVFLESGGQVVIEAENYSERASIPPKNWFVVPTEAAGFPSQYANFRGEGYLQVLPDNTNSDPGGGPGNPPSVDYIVRITTPGTYRLYLRWDSHDGNSDSLYANIVELSDGGGGAIADWYRYAANFRSGEIDRNFATRPWSSAAAFEGTSATGGDTVAQWTIAVPGDYTLRLGMREDGAAVDALIFQLSGLPAPTGDGPPQSDILFNITTSITALVLGESLSQSLEAVGGVSPFTWSVLNGSLPPGMNLGTDGVFSGTPTELGTNTFTVQVMDSTGAVDERTFTVDVVLVLPPPDIRISKVGTILVPGRVVDYFILVQNAGEARGIDVEVSEFLDTRLSLLSVNPPLVDAITTGLDTSILAWNIPLLEPGENKIFSYSVRLDQSVLFGSTIVGGPACTNLEYALLGVCWVGVLTDLASSDCNFACFNVCKDVPLDCTINFTSECLGSAQECWECFPQCTETVQQNFRECLAPISPSCWEYIRQVTGPIDPNEKLVISKFRRQEDGTILSYIQPDQLLTYPIHFENIGEVEALDVFVTDVLDPNLDDSTLELLTPDGGAYDPVTRTVRWELLGRNLQPGETGNVLLSIRPVPGLPSGTEIRNSAEIQFEIFDPLITPDVISIIDTTPPDCSMTPLSAETVETEFEVSWSGTDAIGEIDTYSIYVSANGGTYTPFLTETADTSAVFTGEAGSTYDYFCVAKDTAENAEDQALVSEATIHVALKGDLNGDGCVSKADYNILMADIRSNGPKNPAHDLNGDGVVNRADARTLVGLFTNPRGAPCN